MYGGLEERWPLADLYLNDDDSALSDYGLILQACIDVLSASPSARLMIKEAVSEKWQISLSDLNGGEYWIDVDERLILLDNNALTPSALFNSNYFQNMLLITMIKALRDIWQEKRHGAFDESYRAEHVITMERIRAADCDVVSVLVAWELRCEEHSDLWRHLIGSENGDLAMSFSGFLERTPSAQFNGKALAAVFKQWFRCEDRVNACDHNSLEYLDEVLAETQEQNPFGDKKPSKIKVEILSCLPDKTAYLRGLGSEILNDPLYCGMDDPINQTHLFHIMYDLEATIVENVPFRDPKLAKMMFPDQPQPEKITRVD